MDVEPWCPACGSILAPASVFCQNCGARVEDSEPVYASFDDKDDDEQTETVASPMPRMLRGGPAIAVWRWAMLALNCLLLCIWLTLTAWSWRNPPPHMLPPGAPAPSIQATLTPTDAAGPIVTVPASTPRPTPKPTAKPTRASHGSHGSGRATPPALPTVAPTPQLLPTATAIPAPSATPTPTPSPTPTPPAEI